MSDSLWPHGLQNARFSCPLSTPRAYSNSCPSSQWCHATISSSVIPFSSHLQSFQHQGLFKWVNSSHQVAKVLRVSASASVLPMTIQDWSPLGWTDWISLQSKLLSRVFSSTTVQKQQFSSFLNGSDLTSTHDYWKKNIALTRQNFVSKIMSLFF